MCPPPRPPGRVRIRARVSMRRRGSRPPLDLDRPDRLDAGGLRAVPGGARARPRAAAPRRCRRRAARGLADRRRLPRGGGDRGQGRQRARARLAARPARGRRRGRRRRRARGPTRRPSWRARPARTSCSSSARRQGPRAGRRGARRRAASCSRSRTRTPPGSRARCARSPPPFADPRGRLRLRAGARSSTRRAPTRRACTGATRCGCAANESALASVTAGNGAIYAVRREAYVARRPRHGPRPVVPVQRSSSAAGARSTRRGRARRRRWSRRSRARARASGA